MTAGRVLPLHTFVVQLGPTCGPAANHAYHGSKSGDVWGDEEAFFNYTTPQHFPDPDALQGEPKVCVTLQYARENVDLQPGDIIGYRNGGANETPTHYATRYAAKMVYCGDTLTYTGKFHHDVFWAYPDYDPPGKEDLWTPETTYITIWRRM